MSAVRDYIDAMNHIRKGDERFLIPETAIKPVDITSVSDPLYDELVDDDFCVPQPKQCFLNAYNVLTELTLGGHEDEVKYVLGYAHSIIPIEHAWVKIGDKYFDPTWEICLDKFGEEYISLVELDWETMQNFLKESTDGYLPDFWALYRYEFLPREFNS